MGTLGRMGVNQTVIVLNDAREIGTNDWIVDEVQIQFPDGSYDIGTGAIRATSKLDAERLAISKATDRWVRLVEGTLKVSHPKK
jgi:hypothetical protein